MISTDLCETWISQSEDVRGTNDTEIRKSAGLYLAIKSMMEEYGANAVTTEGYGLFMNAQALLENLDRATFGNHRVAFYADHRKRIRDLATLLGYEAVQKDR